MDANEASGNVKTEPTENVPEISDLVDLSDFEFKRILSHTVETKTIFVEGSIKNKPGAAVLILEKDPFQESQLSTVFQEENSQLKIFQNDIYYNFRYLPKEVFNGIKTTVIYPATEKHIKRHEYQPVHIIYETFDKYTAVTLPFLRREQFSLQWVYNILEHKSEVDRIAFEDPDPETGFVLLPDLKWDGKTTETLYMLAITQKRDILSLRDLTSQHLPLLKNIFEKGSKAIEEKYGLHSSQLRVYLHYQPSFYHLHIHFTFLQYAAPGTSTERSHLLMNVISNIELRSDYYQTATLPFTVKESDNLFAKYEELGIVKRIIKVE